VPSEAFDVHLEDFGQKIAARWTNRSTAASVMAGPQKALFHSPKGWFAVIRTDHRSYRAEINSNRTPVSA
jgi:hypothetical protein